jgi:hypothetical protein
VTYFNANVYCESPTAWAHDDCLPDEEFEYLPVRDGFLRYQRDPWNWAPVYGGEHSCKFCGEAVR